MEIRTQDKQMRLAVALLAAALTFSFLGCSVGRQIVKGPSTSTPTATATRRPTYTPSPSPTFNPNATLTPRATPAPSKPVAAPSQPGPAELGAQFEGAVADGRADCESSGVFGFVRNASQETLPDVYVRAWTDKWAGVWSASTGEAQGEGDGNYQVKIDDGIKAGTYHVAVTNGADSLEQLSPVVDVIVTDSCEGTGAVQWARVDFNQNP